MTAATSITVRVPLRIRRRPGRKTAVMPVAREGGDAAITTRADPALVKALARADEGYRSQGASWTADTPQVKAIAKWSKADPKDVPAAMALYRFPSAEEQLGVQWLEGGAAKAMTNTATFLKSQGRIQEVKPDYAAYVNSSYVKQAIGR